MKQKLTMLELFSGIGAQKRGIENTGLFDLEVIATSDIDKDAILSYACIHHGLTKEMLENYDYPTEERMIASLAKANIGYDPVKNKVYDWNRNKKLVKKYWLACKLSKQKGDISKIETLPYADLLTFSFPCQSISVAGKQEGIIQGETKSGLVYEVLRILQNMKSQNSLPKYLLLENVKNLVGKKFKGDFDNLNEILSEIGYNCYWKVISAKDCNIPQSRERVFGIYIRKDIDNYKYEFPKPIENKFTITDFLFPFCDSNIKDIISLEKAQRITKWNSLQKPFQNVLGRNSICPTITTRSMADAGGMILWSDEIYDKTNLEEDIKKFNKTDSIITKTCFLKEGKTYLKIKKINATEAFRLMGFLDDDANKCIDFGVVETEMHKQAGNSIVTNCIELLFEHLYKSQYDKTYACSDD